MEPRGTELRRWIGSPVTHEQKTRTKTPATDRDDATAGRQELKPVGLHADAPKEKKDSSGGGEGRPKRSGAERDLEAAQRASQIPRSRSRRPPDPVARSRAPSPGLDRISGGRRFGDGEISPRLGPGRAGLVGAGEPWRRRRRRPPPPRRRARTISRPGRSG